MQNPFAFAKTPALDPTQAMDTYSLGQKQALINALRQAAINPPQAQQMGTIASRTSPITPIVQALMGYKAGKDQDALNSQFSNLAKQQQAQTLAMMGGGQSAQPAQSMQQAPQPSPEMQNPLEPPPDPNAAQLAQALAGPQQQQAPQPVKSPMNPGGLDPAFAARQYQTLGPEKYSTQYIEPFIKPHSLQSTAHGLNYDGQTGKYYDADRNPLTAEQVKAAFAPQKTDQPLDELSKLNADFKAGRIEKADYEARKALMTTRATNSNSPIDPDDPKIQSAAERIARYDAPPISGISLNRPFGQAVMDRVEQIHKEAGTVYHGEEYPTRVAAYKAFGTGKQGDAVKAFNVGISHLNTANELADALGNGDIRIINRISQKFAEETGSSAPTNLDTAKEVIKAEIVKSIVGGPGAEKDRENALAAVDRASSPSQLKDGIKIAQRLMGGQLGGLKRQYEQTTGRNDFERLLSKDSQPYLQTKEATGDSSGDAGPVKISSDAEFAKLPSGAEFIGPDGKHRRKP